MKSFLLKDLRRLAPGCLDEGVDGAPLSNSMVREGLGSSTFCNSSSLLSDEATIRWLGLVAEIGSVEGEPFRNPLRRFLEPTDEEPLALMLKDVGYPISFDVFCMVR